MQPLIFTTLTVPGKAELDTLLLVESLRSFGGALAASPIWVLVPVELGPLSGSTQEKLKQAGARTIPLKTDPKISKFPFAVKVMAAASLETQAKNQTELLVFLDRDTIVLQEPTELFIAPDQMLGYRPVHHKLIGSDWEQPPDSFWELIYKICDVPADHLFPMVTHTGERIRPYFNAGIYAVRPDRGMLTQWADIFLKWYRQPQLTAYYEMNQLYTIFIHQAIFSGVLLQNLKPVEMFELSAKINYPLHLHSDIPVNSRPGIIDELVTVRYENIFDEPGWMQLPFSKALKIWLYDQPRVQSSLEDKA